MRVAEKNGGKMRFVCAAIAALAVVASVGCAGSTDETNGSISTVTGSTGQSLDSTGTTGATKESASTTTSKTDTKAKSKTSPASEGAVAEAPAAKDSASFKAVSFNQVFGDSASGVEASSAVVRIARTRGQLAALVREHESVKGASAPGDAVEVGRGEIVAVMVPGAAAGARLSVTSVLTDRSTTKVTALLFSPGDGCKAANGTQTATVWVSTRRKTGKTPRLNLLRRQTPNC